MCVWRWIPKRISSSSLINVSARRFQTFIANERPATGPSSLLYSLEWANDTVRSSKMRWIKYREIKLHNRKNEPNMIALSWICKTLMVTKAKQPDYCCIYPRYWFEAITNVHCPKSMKLRNDTNLRSTCRTHTHTACVFDSKCLSLVQYRKPGRADGGIALALPILQTEFFRDKTIMPKNPICSRSSLANGSVPLPTNCC